MAALPKFSFSGWTSQTLAPKINPATSKPPSLLAPGLVLPPGLRTPGGTPAARLALGAPAGTTDVISGSTGAPGQLVGTTNAANPDLPAWLQSEVDRLNAQDALRKALAGSVTGGATAAPAYDPNLGVAAVTNARANYNAQINQLNEQARLQNLIQQRNQMRPANAFGFNNPMDVERGIGLDREIAGYRNVNLPVASGWVGGGQRRGTIWANGLLNGTGYA